MWRVGQVGGAVGGFSVAVEKRSSEWYSGMWYHWITLSIYRVSLINIARLATSVALRPPWHSAFCFQPA